MFRLFSIFVTFDEMEVFEDFYMFVHYDCIGPAGGDGIYLGVFENVSIVVDGGDKVCLMFC